MSQESIVTTIASSVCAFIIASILFTIFGHFCGLYCQKRDQTSEASSKKPTPGPVYEDVLPKDHHKQPLELKTNIAYAPVLKV